MVFFFKIIYKSKKPWSKNGLIFPKTKLPNFLSNFDVKFCAYKIFFVKNLKPRQSLINVYFTYIFFISAKCSSPFFFSRTKNGGLVLTRNGEAEVVGQALAKVERGMEVKWPCIKMREPRIFRKRCTKLPHKFHVNIPIQYHIPSFYCTFVNSNTAYKNGNSCTFIIKNFPNYKSFINYNLINYYLN